jgi:hypothetical protein
VFSLEIVGLRVPARYMRLFHIQCLLLEAIVLLLDMLHLSVGTIKYLVQKHIL